MPKNAKIKFQVRASAVRIFKI